MDLTPFDSTPDFALPGQGVDYTPPHNYSRTIVPTNGIDTVFNAKIADILRLDPLNLKDQEHLNYILQQLYVQMGTAFSPSPIEYMRSIQGDLNESGQVPGLPGTHGFEHFFEIGVINNEQWSQIVLEFRHMALQFHTVVMTHSQYLNRYQLVFQKYIMGGWVFYACPQTYSDL